MAFSLFLLMDSIGNIPLFIAILKDIPRKRQFQIILRELVIALVVMVLFNYLGEFLLTALQVSQYAVLISGGIILFLIALKMIFPPSRRRKIPQSRKRAVHCPSCNSARCRTCSPCGHYSLLQTNGIFYFSHHFSLDRHHPDSSLLDFSQ